MISKVSPGQAKLLVLLRVLRQQSPLRADRVEDRFSFVLREIKDDVVTDGEMVIWLFEAVAEELDMNRRVMIRETCSGCKGKKLTSGRACTLCGGTGERQRMMKLEELVQLVAQELRGSR